MTQPRTKSGQFAPKKKATKKAVAKPSKNRQATGKQPAYTKHIEALEARIIALEKAAASEPVAEPQGLEEGDWIEATPENVRAVEGFLLPTYSPVLRNPNNEAVTWDGDEIVGAGLRYTMACRTHRPDFLSRAEVTARKLGTWPVDPAVKAAKELAEKEERLVFGARVRTPQGEGIYHYRDTDATCPHWVILPGGESIYLEASDITLIEP